MEILKTLRKQFTLLLLTVILAGLSSCSNGDRRDELLKLIPDDVMMVCTFNPNDFIESAGGKVEDGTIVLPDAAEKIMKMSMSKKERKTLDRFLEPKGLNLHGVVIALFTNDNDRTDVMMLFPITDKEKFGEWLDEFKFDDDKEGEYTVYTPKHGREAIVVDGDVAYLVDRVEDSSEAADKVDDWKKEAKKKPLADWKRKYLADGGMASSYMVMLSDINDRDVENFYSLEGINEDAEIIGAQLNLDGLHLQVTASSFDKSGKSTDMLTADAISTLDQSVLNLFPMSYNFFGAMSMDGEVMEKLKQEMSRGFNQEMVKELFGEDLRKYGVDSYDPYWGYWQGYSNPMRDSLNALGSSDAFVAPFNEISAMGFGFGVDKGAKLDFRHPDKILKSLNCRAAARFGNEKAAKAYYNAWNRLNYAGQTPGGKYITFRPYDLGGEELYMNLLGSDMVLSNVKDPATATQKFPCDMSDAVAFASVNIAKDSALMKALPLKIDFGVKAWAKASRNTATLDINLTDTEGGFIENLLNMGSKIAAMATNRTYDDYDEYDWSDSIAVEEVVVEVADTADSTWVEPVEIAIDEY